MWTADHAAQRWMGAGELDQLDERHDQGHGADHHRTQTNGHALPEFTCLAGYMVPPASSDDRWADLAP